MEKILLYVHPIAAERENNWSNKRVSAIGSSEVNRKRIKKKE